MDARFDGFPAGFEQAVALVENELCTLALFRKGEIARTAAGRGIAPLLNVYDAEPALLLGAAVADKIIGRAAAMILARAGAKAVYGAVMSQTARDLLLAHGISASFGELVPHIVNRAGDGLCPIEQSVLEENDPAAGIEKIRARLAAFRAGGAEPMSTAHKAPRKE